LKHLSDRRYEFHGPNGLEEKKATIDEKDDVWTSVRHMHMKDTIDKLMQDFNKFCQENTNFTDKFLSSCGGSVLIDLGRKRLV
jgi:syntaxin-binding protein 1